MIEIPKSLFSAFAARYLIGLGVYKDSKYNSFSSKWEFITRKGGCKRMTEDQVAAEAKRRGFKLEESFNEDDKPQ